MKGRKLWSNALRIGLSLVALGLLFREVGGRDLFETIRSADLALLFFAWLLFLLGIVVRTFRWRALLRGLELRPPFWQLLRLYLVGGFFNSFLPSGFGGDVVRVVELAQGAETSAAVGTVFVDRLTGILSLMAMGLLALPFAPGIDARVGWGFAILFVAGLVAGLLLLEGRLLRGLTARLPGQLSLVGQGKLAQVYDAVTGCGFRAIALALGISTLFNLLNVAVYWLCGIAVGIDVGLGFYFVSTTMLSLTLLIPISVGGLGLRDLVAQPLFASAGASAGAVAAMTLSVYAVTALAGLVGGLVYLGQGVGGLAGRRSLR